MINDEIISLLRTNMSNFTLPPFEKGGEGVDFREARNLLVIKA